jgi:hypothetical protein
MITKASGHSALLLAAGLWICYICFAGPSLAAAGTDDGAASSTPAGVPAAPIALSKYTKLSSHHGKKSAQRKSDDVAQKSSGKKAVAAETAADNNAPSVPPSSAIPPSIANANAQLSAANTLAAGNARAMSERANSIVQSSSDASSAADVPIVSADQLNDLDRALRENPPPAATLTMASANVPVMATSSPLMATSSGNTTWDRTSLIGKIFIGFGVLLTMASAVRMFIA